MKNKYESYWQEQEGKYKNLRKLKEKLLLYKFYFQVLSTTGIEDFKAVYSGNIVFLSTILLSITNDCYCDYLLKNVLSKLNPQDLMMTYIRQLTKFLTKQDFKGVDICMNSFKLSGLISDIKLSKGKELFRLTTLDGKFMMFKPTTILPDEIDNVNGHCHSATEDSCMQLSDNEKIFAVTAIMSNTFNEPYYHSFVVCNGIVNDFSQNIVMSFDNYKELFKPQIIMSVEGKQLLRNIKRLKERDKDFKESNYCDVLKYAMHKQMKKEKNMARR